MNPEQKSTCIYKEMTTDELTKEETNQSNIAIEVKKSLDQNSEVKGLNESLEQHSTQVPVEMTTENML